MFRGCLLILLFSAAYFMRQLSAVALERRVHEEGLHKAHTQGSCLHIPTLLLEAAAIDKSLQCLAQRYFRSGYTFQLYLS